MLVALFIHLVMAVVFYAIIRKLVTSNGGGKSDTAIVWTWLMCIIPLVNVAVLVMVITDWWYSRNGGPGLQL
jgi:hypothetical protein